MGFDSLRETVLSGNGQAIGQSEGAGRHAFVRLGSPVRNAHFLHADNI
eukprot:CAMPEP_0198448288 /NCGR_PEP_ID=MMETSP1453-20131121/3279_1 /TAXON_ID=1461543 ORGANISM="Unidentified sp., Strain RCC701" /NCGR_SAMPLE_ID=MMETSP1453 /ASSEMBLY_ACC=CAM_ASM_001118 /LENGTH=47 /DNA_ID= /DNA_START= /DNA_END= /DNA_ORIENTATION=